MRVFRILLITATIAIAPFPTGLFAIDAPTTDHRITILGYTRDAFGSGWNRLPEGCSVRERAMAASYRAACTVPYRQWGEVEVTDPYTLKPLLAQNVEIDHLYPLSAAWDMGAHSWTAEKRNAFANDPHNLIVVDGAVNRSKSDALPAEWMPPARTQHCGYALQLAKVARRYELPVTRADLSTMRRACAGLSGLRYALFGVGMFPTAQPTAQPTT